MTVLLAKPWEGQDPTGWWMSEKLDGVRAIWRGGELWSRNGNRFHAPEWFRAAMPLFPLDGELYLGRGQFEDTVSIVRSHNAGDRWETIRFYAFDLYPTEPRHDLPFEQRVEIVRHTRDFFGGEAPCWEYVPHVRCEGLEHLTVCVDRIVAGGGEGIMLRAPGSLYERKRSSTLLKAKRFLDAEATVTGHVPGKGKHAGRLGALACVTDAGVPFEIGTGFSDAQRETPPPIGARVTVRYQELTEAGVPRFPVFVTARDYE